MTSYILGALLAIILLLVVIVCQLAALLHRQRRPERPARRRPPVVHHAVTAIQPVSDERYTPGVVRIAPGYAEGRRVR